MQNLDPTYLRYIYDSLIKGSIHPENESELPEGLIGLYQEAFEENIPVMQRQKLLQRFALFALLKKEVSISFVAEVLEESENDILEFINTYASWFNSPESGKYQLYHERLKVYLLQKLSEGEVKELTFKIFQFLEPHFESSFRNELNEYALYYYLDYFNVIVNLDLKLKKVNELHKTYFIKVKKDPSRLFYLENGRSHRDRHLRQATVYFSRKNDLKILDELVHEINDFQHKFKSPLEIATLISSSNRDEQLYGYNLCVRIEEKLFVLVFYSVHNKGLDFSAWHKSILSEFWKEIQPKNKIYDLPSFFLLDLIPFLVDLNLTSYEEINFKRIDFRLVYSFFAYKSFDLFENQVFNEEDFIDSLSTSKVDLLYYFELRERISNQHYFKKIDEIEKLDFNYFKFLLNIDGYFPKIPKKIPTIEDFLKLCYVTQDFRQYCKLPNFDFDSIKLGDLWEEHYDSALKSDDINSSLLPIDLIFNHISFSEVFYNKYFKIKIGNLVIVYYGLSLIKNNELDFLLNHLSKLKSDIKHGYTRDSKGSKSAGDEAFEYNEMVYSIFSYCLFAELLTLDEFERFLMVVIKDDEWNQKYFKPLIIFKNMIQNVDSNINLDLLKNINSDRLISVISNIYYYKKSKQVALQFFSDTIKSRGSQNDNYYEINFVNQFRRTLLNETTLIDYYNNTNDIRDDILPALKYGIQNNNPKLIWNFAHVNQSDMQKFGSYRSFSWFAVSEIISLKYKKFSDVFDEILAPFLESAIKPFCEIDNKATIYTHFAEPIESVDLIELLESLKTRYKSGQIQDFEKMLFDVESGNFQNLNNLKFLKNIYLDKLKASWGSSMLKTQLENNIVKLKNEEFFISDYNHHLSLLGLYYAHPAYVNALALYSELFEKYKVRPDPLPKNSKIVSKNLIEQLQRKNNLLPLEISPSNLMYSYFMLGQEYFEIEDFQNAIKYFNKSIESRAEFSGVKLGKCFLESGKSYYNVNNIKKAIERLNEAKLEMTKSKDNLTELSIVYYYLGLCFEEKKDWNKSISNYIACRNIEKKSLKKGHSDHLNVLKSILRVSKECNEKYHKKYLKQLLATLKVQLVPNYKVIGYYYLTLARKYREDDEFNLELFYLKCCVKYLNASSYKSETSRLKILFLLSISFEKNKFYKKAYNVARVIEKVNVFEIDTTELHILLARIAFHSSKYKLALKYYKKLNLIICDSNLLFRIAYCYQQLQNIHESLEYYIKYLMKEAEGVLGLFIELDDDDFIDFSDKDLIQASKFIEHNISADRKVEKWILKLIGLINEKNKTQIP